MPASLLEQVQRQVATLDAAARGAIQELEGGWYTSDQDKASANAIRGLTASAIPAWAKRGLDAAKANKLPGSNGWPGWIKAGEEFLDGIKRISDAADGAELQAIIEVVKAAPSHVGADLSNAGKAVVKTASDAAGAVAGAAGSTVASALAPLWPVLLVVGAGAALLGVLGRKASL